MTSLSLVLFLMSFFGFHDFHVSVMDVTYRTETKSLDFELKLFSDDFETALNKKYDLNLDLLTNPNQPVIDSISSIYFQENLSLEINEKKCEIVFIGTELVGGMVYAYFEIEDVNNIEVAHIKSTILADYFTDQSNIIHFHYKTKLKTIRLKPEKYQESIRF